MKRDIQPKLMSLLSDPGKKEVIIIEGARQVGKSYLVDDTLNRLDVPYLAFDLEKNSKIRRQINRTEDFEDFRTLLNDQYNLQNGSILFLDEAQECRKLAMYVKSMKEDWPGVRVILTGSSMNRFFSEDERIPVGRYTSLRVFSFNFSEFVRCLGKDDLADFIHEAPGRVPASRHELLLKLYDDYLKVGGYPEAVKAFANNENSFEIVDDILAALEEDFFRKEEYEPFIFDNVLTVTANFLGTPSKLSHIDSTKYFAKKIIEAMKGWHIILEVQPYGLDPFTTGFLPKRYLHDVGVINRKRSLAAPSISMINTLDQRLRTPLGGLFENAALLSLLEGGAASGTVSTWKKGKSTDIEVDFLMDSAALNCKIPIECKAALKIRKKHYKNLVHYLELTRQIAGVLVSAAPMDKITTETGKIILNVPIYLATSANIENYVKSELP